MRLGAGQHTVREAAAVNGFIDVAIDGQRHSSNPSSSSFDGALTGATTSTVTSVRLSGGAQDTLVLGSQQLAGALTVQAPNITVSGAVQASTVSLAASGWVTVDAASRIDAGRAGGVNPLMEIDVSAAVFVNSGQLHADGAIAGRIRVDAENILNAGPITAENTAANGNGGQVHISFTSSYIATTAAVVSASSATVAGGQLTIDGGGTGRLYSSGRHLVTGSVGGSVDLLGREIILAGATVDASGEAGGGSVRIGGDFHGRNPAVVNSQTVKVTPASTIRADASRKGSGGRVFVWADRTTEYQGTVSARGGSAGGSGGFIEVSGHGDLKYGGMADAGAPLGKSGTLLLDPKNITVSDAPVGVFPQFEIIDPHPTVSPEGYYAEHVVLLSNGNIVLTSPGDNFGGEYAGAFYLFDGLSGALISIAVGSHPHDLVAYGSVIPLSNGSFVVVSPDWNGFRGAVTWGSGKTGVSGTISDANSLVGSNPNDFVGSSAGRYIPSVTVLSNGNYVVESPFWNRNRGAVTWGNGSTGVSGMVSDANSLIGSTPNDQVGSGSFFGGVYFLNNGNYLVDSPHWSLERGAVTWADGNTGIRGTISAANSLVGSQRNDRVGDGGSNRASIIPLKNGNYLVPSPNWNGNRGAVTWGNGNTGVSGIVSESNSLVGSNYDDSIGYGGSFGQPTIVPLSNGNYVIDSPGWNKSRGAVTWGNGSTGVSGVVSEANSLVGDNSRDQVGDFYYGTTPLSNGNYVVSSQHWHGQRGAVTWGNGNSGVSGVVSDANSLVGSHVDDQVGEVGVIQLSNGNYVVPSPNWNGQRGAVTWGNGSTGVHGPITETNSLVGTNPKDQVGYVANDMPSVIPLSSGNYVVVSPFWNDRRGAVTWANGSTGVQGPLTDANSLVGTSHNDLVGSSFSRTSGITPLSNGNYVVTSVLGGRGAATLGNGDTGISGTVSDANSLVGTDPNDFVGQYVIPLSNGNYVVDNLDWNSHRGAVTWADGNTGISGPVSDGNSLVGSHPGEGYASNNTGDLVGWGVTPLSNGNYVVVSGFWNDYRGAVTWGNGNTGIRGTVSEANSLVGSVSRDGVASGGYGAGIILLNNGNYLVRSPVWNSNRGAVTWCDGSRGISGPVSEANSLVGSNPNDMVSTDQHGNPLVKILRNGNYLVGSSSWDGNRGALTWLSGTSGRTLDGLGTITPQNSLVGVTIAIENSINDTFLAQYGTNDELGIMVGFADPNLLKYATAQAQSLTITPALLTGTLDTGTAVVLQASNDITVNSPITVSAGGHGGALTLQAGRSIVLNASITTDNGALTLKANDELSGGVVDAQRDPGKAVITMAPGTSLNTGSGALTVALRDGAGLTNSDSGAITLGTVTAGSVSVANIGPSAGSDEILGPVTTSGLQNYGNPNGTTYVTGNLTATDNPITFASSVVVSDGVTVDAGASTVNFAGSGTQTLQSGPSTSFVNLNHAGTGTLQLTSGLTVTGTFTNSAGTFDANDQAVTVAGSATVAGGTYLAGVGPQTFSNGLSITGGSFTSSSGPMTVTGGVTLTGGLLSGVGTIDSVTALGGMLAPGTASPGVLTIGGAVTFNSLATLSVLINGTDAGTGYAQVQARGPIDLGSSTLTLSFASEPPVGSALEILTNTGTAPINNAFIGLDEGTVFAEGGYQFQITYQGGTGANSVVLTRLA
jgi:hypothetical protein